MSMAAEELIILAFQTAVIQLAAPVGAAAEAPLEGGVGREDEEGPGSRGTKEPAQVGVDPLGLLSFPQALAIRGITDQPSP